MVNNMARRNLVDCFNQVINYLSKKQNVPQDVLSYLHDELETLRTRSILEFTPTLGHFKVMIFFLALSKYELKFEPNSPQEARSFWSAIQNLTDMRDTTFRARISELKNLSASLIETAKIENGIYYALSSLAFYYLKQWAANLNKRMKTKLCSYIKNLYYRLYVGTEPKYRFSKNMLGKYATIRSDIVFKRDLNRYLDDVTKCIHP